ncbi:hypothetical protein N1031_06940 [Herbiconiux moechotypicola]|uniref:Uncharacterized protein n=1 Tax=Herbiconiux moechotypicola TaxID=637393 RepID=A0ABN3DG53_9MICO|nr:hypothetical protein [Herbiconiux moechotypicola]MCS5729492.1 hypothetical protein [Herbiconiux moechotypicola]
MATRKTPAAAEALGERIPFSYSGVDYLIDPTTEWSYELLLALENGRFASFIQGVLGDDQHEIFRATKPKIGELNDFVIAIQKAAGVSGN